MAEVETREKDVERGWRSAEEEEDGRTGPRNRGRRRTGSTSPACSLGGTHILIAVDASASMLDDTLVNVIRRRNMPVSRQLQSSKWQRAVRTRRMACLNSFPLESQYQIFRFNTQAMTVLPSNRLHVARRKSTRKSPDRRHRHAARHTPPVGRARTLRTCSAPSRTWIRRPTTCC